MYLFINYGKIDFFILLFLKNFYKKSILIFYKFEAESIEDILYLIIVHYIVLNTLFFYKKILKKEAILLFLKNHLQ